jgi:AcrR family transcriptional regulator
MKNGTRSGESPTIRSSRSHVAPVRNQRLPRAERERHILEEAVRFFAEVGFGGDTRELAKRAQVTHALLFRYFPSKDALIERVYREVYLGRWNPYWELLIEDRSIPLRERLVEFYKLYAQTILSYEWVRLFMFAGLKGSDLNRRFFALVTERIVTPICREIRIHYGLPDFDLVPPVPAEIELVWGVNSRIFYFGVRKYIYGMAVPKNLDALIDAEVHTFFDDIGRTLTTLVGLPPSDARRVNGRNRAGQSSASAPRRPPRSKAPRRTKARRAA